jgi:signal transduction histidine kinase
MKQHELEPGFLQVYRFFSVIRIVFWMLIGPILVVVSLARESTLTPTEATQLDLIERLTLPNTAPVVALELLLLALLMFPPFIRRLGRTFLPLTLVVGMIPLLIGYYWWPTTNPLQTPFVIFFFVMLVLIAWQYPMRFVLAYVVGLSLFQATFSLPYSAVPWTVEAGWLVLQGAMMLIIGYVVVVLVALQREQRQALTAAYARQTEVNVRLQQYASTLEELAISRERNRLARELHDTLAHALSGVTVQLEAIRSLWERDPGEARRILDAVDRSVREGLQEARRALAELRASPLQDLGLPLALRELAASAARRAGAALELNLAPRIDCPLRPEVEQGIYRIAQEALENVVRHAMPFTIHVELLAQDGVLMMSIRDDGLGLESAPGPAGQSDGRQRLGIQGMRERSALIGGRLDIHSTAGKGTEIRLSVPMEESMIAPEECEG